MDLFVIINYFFVNNHLFKLTRNALFFLLFGFLSNYCSGSGISGTTEKRAEIERNISNGFAAQAYFTLSTHQGLANLISNPVLQKQIFTYHLDSNNDAYRAYPKSLKHLKQISLIHKNKLNHFIYDAYLHGNIENNLKLVVKIEKLDIRKFLHQSLAFTDAHDSLSQIQAHFAEFCRKQKVILQSPENFCDDFVIPNVDFLLNTLGIELSQEGKLKNFYENNGQISLSRITEFLKSEILKHKISESKTNELNQIIESLSFCEKIRQFRFTNNCREPGNYEISLNDQNHRKLMKGNFYIEPSKYDQILKAYHGEGIKYQGTGIRSPFLLESNRTNLTDFHAIYDFPKVQIDKLSLIDNSFDDTKPIKSGRLLLSTGRIPYEDYFDEVKHKAAFRLTGTEPLSYTRVNDTLPPPYGFKPPDLSDTILYWNSNDNQGKIVPYRFKNYKDLYVYDVFFSEFEVNGVYLGNSDNGKFNKEKSDGRQEFHFKNLKNIKIYEVFKDREQALRIHLLSDNPQGYNLILGNLDLKLNEVQTFLLGIGTQPHICRYNDNVFQEKLRYGLFYNSKNQILDHHSSEIGIEMVRVNKISDDQIKIQLLAHERIMPVWEAIIFI